MSNAEELGKLLNECDMQVTFTGWKAELGACEKERDTLKAQLAEAKKERDQLIAENEKMRAVIEAARELLRNVGCDWYVAHFHRSETPRGMETGIVAKIANRDLQNRALFVFQRLHESIQALDTKERENG